ncbi:MAG: diaminopimelate epimerase [Gammaproteobacteria bacterium]|nr:diaminopimelate epimerase [Gammaproteobacteria bacterium]
MTLHFTKMHGAGNDFVVIDGNAEQFEPETARIQALADRHTGVGFDQLLLVEPADSARADFRYRIFNANGSEVEQCGNGVRCVARFLHDKGLVDRSSLVLESLAGDMEVELLEDSMVRVNMGVPKLDPVDVPLAASDRSLTYHLSLEGQEIEFGAVSMGNPHAVLEVSDVAATPVEDIGEMLESHSIFPQRANIGFMERRASNHILLRVFERGVGETAACGSGACAAVVWGILAHELDQQVHVDLPGGHLVISWAGEGTPVYMTGPAVTVYHGSIDQ